MTYLYNTLTKKKEIFKPLKEGEVSMYSCGPTVYGKIHIGNIRTYLLADTLRRLFEYSGYTVHHIKNITDVGHLTRDDMSQGDSGEDKIEKQARSENMTPQDIASFYEAYFHTIEETMYILPAHTFPKATEYIPQMITFIETLLEKGYAYEKNGNVFFNITTFKPYGKLSGNTLENLKTGARLEKHPDKKNAWDFALWLKAPKDHLMQWNAPWSRGYPGWHIECSAMSTALLGSQIDIHTGGEDNIFPHHEAEIAQSECATGKSFVKYWIHTRHLLFDGEKMSKSKGTFLTLEEIQEKGFTPQDLRIAFLSSHYRSQLNFSWKLLEQSHTINEKIRKTFEKLYTHTFSPESTGISPLADSVEMTGKNKDLVEMTGRNKDLVEMTPSLSSRATSPHHSCHPRNFHSALPFRSLRRRRDENTRESQASSSYLHNILSALQDDLNTSLALTHLQDLLKEIHQKIESHTLSPEEISAYLKTLESTFSLLGLHYETEEKSIPQEVHALLKKRKLAREKKDFETSDRLREKIQALGFTVEDTSEGQKIV